MQRSTTGAGMHRGIQSARTFGGRGARMLTLTLFVLTACATGTVAAQDQWKSLATDTRDGANSLLPDAKQVWFRYDPVGDTLWFRIAVYGTLEVHAFGINIVAQTNDGSPSIEWWGSNKFVFNKLVSVWVSGPPYTGIDGIADAIGIVGRNYTNLGQNNVRVVLDGANNEYQVGIKRTDLMSGPPDSLQCVVAVGSNQAWNDDVPNTGSIRLPPANASSVVSPAGKDAVTDQLAAAVIPNPANGTAVVRFVAERSGAVELALYSAIGVRIGTLFMGEVEAGSHEIPITTGSIAAGAYYVALTDSRGHRAMFPLLLAH